MNLDKVAKSKMLPAKAHDRDSERAALWEKEFWMTSIWRFKDVFELS